MDTVTLTTDEIETAFLGWLRGEPVVLTLAQFQQAIAESEAQLPEKLCEAAGYPVGTTAGHAVRCSIGFCDQTGVEHRLDAHLHFPTEADSLEWWRAGTVNPDQILLRHAGGGRWEIRVAPTNGPEPNDWKGGF